MGTPVATFRKYSREEVRISLPDFMGHVLNVRVWFEADDGEMRPGKQGMALRLVLLSELQRGLEQARLAEGRS